MNYDFVKTAVYTSKIRVGDVLFNANAVKEGIKKANEQGASIIVFPQLCLSGSTLGDLLNSSVIYKEVEKSIEDIAKETKDILAFVGFPFNYNDKLYNACAVINNGSILGIVPKTNISADEINSSRYFSPAKSEIEYVNFAGFNNIPFGVNLIFQEEVNNALKLAVEIGSDKDLIISPAVSHSLAGANVIVNLGAESDYAGAKKKRESSIKEISKRTAVAYLFANAGVGESTTDLVFSGHSIIAENGAIIAESKPFDSGLTVADVDIGDLQSARLENLKNNSGYSGEYITVKFKAKKNVEEVSRVYEKYPFIIDGEEDATIRIQAEGLKKRLEHTNSKSLVLGLSGGLDSTLALIVAVKTMKLMNLPLKNITTITMPCFGTSSRTLENSIKMAKAYGVSLKKIDITKAVKRHLKDIGHSEDLHDAAYENAQARERTQVLMDMANSLNGLVIGTGDLSELALGWATYNGDHMSNYAVNASIPKTLVRHLVRYTANNSKGKLKATLLDVLDTPVSPELIPLKDNKMSQVTEDIVGPYALHDFFLYHLLKGGFSPTKTFIMAKNTFSDEFDQETVLKWLKVFIKRFFAQQFKRSCLPDGVKATKISLSPRGAWVMPSDTVSTLWLSELENIKL